MKQDKGILEIKAIKYLGIAWAVIVVGVMVVSIIFGNR